MAFFIQSDFDNFFMVGLPEAAWSKEQQPAKYELQIINNQIAILNRISYNKRSEIAYLHFAVQELEGYVRGLENHNQQQHEIQNE